MRKDTLKLDSLLFFGFLAKRGAVSRFDFRSRMKRILKFKAAAIWQLIFNPTEESKMRVDHATRSYLEYHKANPGKKYN